MAYETIRFTVKGQVATIALNRPESLNAFNDQMILETILAFRQVQGDGKIRCAVITGVGNAFSSGQDLKDVQAREGDFSIGEHLRNGYNKLVTQMVLMDKPVIAAVNGVAAGAGFGVALAADIRIASSKATFILAFSRVGLIPDSGISWLLPRLIGYTRAYEMAITADRVSATKALDWGFVNQVVPHEQLPEIVQAWARRLSEGPTLAFGLTKRAMTRAQSMSLDEALEYEASLQEVASRTQDSEEGIKAFIDKRDAEFKGK